MTKHQLLEAILKDRKRSYPSLSASNFFEVFCVDTILQDFDLSDAEIEAGIVDGPIDGGIDAAYVFVNRTLLLSIEDFPFDRIGHKGASIDLFIVQAKTTSARFSEHPVTKLVTSIPMLLRENPEVFNSNIKNIFSLFVKARERLATKFPDVSVRVFYCSKSTTPPSDLVKAKAGELKKAVRNEIGEVKKVDFTFLGAHDLYNLSGKQKQLVKKLPTTRSLSMANSHVVLCTLQNYLKFITDEEEELMPRLFEANVRAYQGEIEINKEIARSVQNPQGGIDFWWLNNGVTIVADKIELRHDCLIIENPLIVNGLQTSQEIYNAGSLPESDERMILVRVLAETNQEKRDAIIRATNRQTNILHSSFRATEQIHYDLEVYLKDLGFYYDRRKNYYKREGKPANKIISISRLAQAVLAVLEQRPDTARARPTSVFKKEGDYEKIFSSNEETHPLKMYGVIVRLLEVVENHFAKIKSDNNQIQRNNLRFHVLMVLSWKVNGNVMLPAKRIAQLEVSKIDENSKLVKTVTQWVFRQFNKAGPEDRTAKDQAFTSRLREQFEHSPPTAES